MFSKILIISKNLVDVKFFFLKKHAKIVKKNDNSTESTKKESIVRIFKVLYWGVAF
jgi:hypothetical protein